MSGAWLARLVTPVMVFGVAPAVFVLLTYAAGALLTTRL